MIMDFIVIMDFSGSASTRPDTHASLWYPLR